MSDLTIRDATAADLPEVVRLLAQDQMGGEDDSPGPPLHAGYVVAFDAIEADPNQRLVVAEQNGRIVGTFQLSYTPGLLFRGGWRATIEAVRVDEIARGQRIGEAMMRWTIDTCRRRDCRVIQLTSNSARVDAHRFYDRLGFKQSHLGFKMMLED